MGILVAAAWGLAFVATRVGLDSFTPAELAALRFLIAGIPALALARPAISWTRLIATGLTLYAGQFLFQFFGIAHGMPPGLASFVVQTQAFFTVIFAAVTLRERPTPRQTLGMTIAFVGLLLIAVSAGPDLRLVGFALTLGSAVSWGVGNIFLKRIGATAALALVVWPSLVVPPLALALSLVVDGPAALARAVTRATWLGWGAALYLGVIATIGAYTLWARLLRRYAVARVAPFALLVPLFGALGSAVAFGERFGPLRLAGMACVLAGLVTGSVPWRWIDRGGRAPLRSTRRGGADARQ